MGIAKALLRLFLGSALLASAGIYANARATEAAHPRLDTRGFAADTDTVVVPGEVRADTDTIVVPGAVVADTDTIAAPEPIPADTIPVDSMRADTVPAVADTIPADTLVAGQDTAAVTVDTSEQAPEGGFPEPDDVFDNLMALGGYRTVEYRGERVELDVIKESVTLRGDAQANYATSELQADTITYLAGAQFIAAEGNISLSGQGVNEVTNDSALYYDVSRQTGTIMDARTAFAERGTEWFVRGTATLAGTGTAYVETGQFTSCEIDDPHYFFKAGQIKIVNEQVIVAWPVVLYIHDVPLIWLPFFAQDIRPGRRSGFLPPRFGFNDIIGGGDFDRQISDFGYYFALSPFYDAQLTIDWFSNNFVRFNGAFRYDVRKKFLRGNVMASYSFGEDGANSVEFRVSHNQKLSPVTDFKVNANFVQNTRIFQDQSFDPRQQTQNITSDLGFNHKFPFASLSLSARRQQFLGDQTGRVDMTLPQLALSFSPITLFKAPPNLAGPFNNITLSGSTNFQRQERRNQERDDRITTTGGVSASLRLGSFTVNGSGRVNDDRTVPFDSTAVIPPASFSKTTMTYGGSASYQINLLGSTTLRPNVTVDAASFKSPDTFGGFISAPTRLSIGASLSTDVFGFYPGFASFSRIRHKISTRFNWSFAPAVTLADSLLEIPGFPGGNAKARNTLSITLNQTFEAKARQAPAEEQAEVEGTPGDPTAAAPQPAEVPPADLDSLATQVPDSVATTQVPDSVGTQLSDSTAIQPADTIGARRGRNLEEPFTRRQQQRNVVLLSINSSPLQFDFTKENEPALTTDRWQHQLSSDLLRGLSLNFALDLFEGTGEERKLSVFVSELTGSFSFSSGGAVGPGSARPRRPDDQFYSGVDSRYRLNDFGDDIDRAQVPEGSGPWTVSLVYSLRRVRSEEQGLEQQSIGANISLRPTPNWRLQWSTQYNITESEFGANLVQLERDLHRWMARFAFSRSPNGNFLFQVSVNLRDAPDLKLDYDQQTIR